jgi:hypothetical protein
MLRSRTVLFAAAVVVLAVVVGAQRSQALHRNTPSVVQITDAPSVALGDPSFAGRSNVLLFHADGDLLGNGNTVPQIFVFDLAGRVKKGQHSLYQATTGALGSYAPSGAKRGRVLAFHSEADLLGNGSSGRQIFAAVKAKWKKGLVPLFQVTRGPGESFDAVVSDTGKYLLFSSTDDLLAEGLVAGTHLYRVDLRRLPKSDCPGYPCPVEGNPGLMRITSAVVEGVTVDKKGDRVAFVSRADAAGTGCGTGIAQLFLWDNAVGTIAQMTCGAADSGRPRFTRNFRGILFESAADLLGTAQGHTQIYQLDVQAVPPTLSQLTFGTDGDSRSPAPNGTTSRNRFFFTSTADLTGGGGAGVERLYEYDIGAVERLSSGEPILSSLDGQFQFAAFASDADLAGTGNDLPQMFIVNAYAAPALDPTPTPTATATPAPSPALERIVLAPSSKTLDVGAVQSFTATGHFSNGSTQNLTQALTYASSAPGVVAAPNTPGSVSQVQAVAPGMALISAVHGPSGVSTTSTGDDATITVLGALERIVVSPASNTIAVDEIDTYTALGHYVGGGTQNLTQTVTWASSDPGVAAALNTPGNKSQVQGVSPGAATIAATDPSSGISSTDSGDDGALTVIGPLERITLSPVTKTLAVGQFEFYTATGHFGGGSTQNLTQRVEYFSSNTAVAVAPNSPGVRSRVDAVGSGVATISAVDPVTGVGTTASGDDATLTVTGP